MLRGSRGAVGSGAPTKKRQNTYWALYLTDILAIHSPSSIPDPYVHSLRFSLPHLPYLDFCNMQTEALLALKCELPLGPKQFLEAAFVALSCQTPRDC